MTTRGESGSTGDPPICGLSDLGMVREQVGRNAGAVIGAREELFLPYIDPEASDGVMHAIDATLEEFSASIHEIMSRLKPDVVITHGTNGDYCHPQHIFTQLANSMPFDYCNPDVPGRCLTDQVSLLKN